MDNETILVFTLLIITCLLLFYILYLNQNDKEGFGRRRRRRMRRRMQRAARRARDRARRAAERAAREARRRAEEAARRAREAAERARRLLLEKINAANKFLSGALNFGGWFRQIPPQMNRFIRSGNDIGNSMNRATSQMVNSVKNIKFKKWS